MKRHSFRIAALFLAVSMLAPSVATSDIFHWIKVGAWRTKVEDAGSAAETVPGPEDQGRYFRGMDMFDRSSFRDWGTRFACRNFTDAESNPHDYWLAGAPYGSDDEQKNQWAVKYATAAGDTATITSYYRYTPPVVTVDGFILTAKFPAVGQDMEVNAAKIPGTADVLVQSHIRNKMGLDITQKVLAWSQADHDDYAIWEWDIKNTGNVDRDEAIELSETLHELYIARQLQYRANCVSWDDSDEWSDWVGMVPGDSLRMTYVYHGDPDGAAPSTMGMAKGYWHCCWYYVPAAEDYFGHTQYLGDLVLFINAVDAAGVPTGVDDWRQPQMHTICGPDWGWWKQESGLFDELTAWPGVWETMAYGFKGAESCPPDQKGPPPPLYYMHEDPTNPQFAGVDPTTHHETSPAYRSGMLMPDDVGWTAAWWSTMPNYAMGPYELPIGDSIRYVWAQVAGAISEENAQYWGKRYFAGTIADDLEGYEDMPLPPCYGRDGLEAVIADPNDHAKDAYIYTGRDSLFMNAGAAKYNFEHNYDIPIPPPAPDVEVTSSGGGIWIKWGSAAGGEDISETVGDFAGYRIYRALGSADSTYRVIKEFTGTAVHEYKDTTAVKGQGYYYYVAAFDDGTEHTGDYKHPAGTSLESGMFLNRTTAPAYALEEPGLSLDDIRVVPNPYHLSAAVSELQFVGEHNKIMFSGLPPYCTIKIYTESGDLVKVLEHINEAGSDAWGTQEAEWMVSETGQRIVSGIYIAYIQVRDSAGELTGEDTFVKFVIVR